MANGNIISVNKELAGSCRIETRRTVSVTQSRKCLVGAHDVQAEIRTWHLWRSKDFWRSGQVTTMGAPTRNYAIYKISIFLMNLLLF